MHTIHKSNWPKNGETRVRKEFCWMPASWPDDLGPPQVSAWWEWVTIREVWEAPYPTHAPWRGKWVPIEIELTDKAERSKDGKTHFHTGVIVKLRR